MSRVFLFLFCSFVISCSPIQTVEGLGAYSTSSKFSSPFSEGDEPYPDYYRLENYNDSISPSSGRSTKASDEYYGEFRLVNHPLVQKQIDKFTSGRGKAIMQAILERSNRYIPMMSRILREGGLPEAFAYIPIIESGFESDAESTMKAMGYWQFKKDTAKDYNLTMNNYVDERQDPELSTRAAVKYLKDLYHTFESWPLALAAYNAGPGKINKIITNNFNRNFWYLTDNKRLPEETIEYIPKIIAAIKIARNPHSYGFRNLNPYPPMEYELKKVPKRSYFSGIARKYNIPERVLRELNPMYKTDFIPGSGNTSRIRFPIY